MRTKVVYVLISNDSDYYLEQLFISVYSLCLFNPQTIRILITDKRTNDSLKNKRERIKIFFSEIIVAEVPEDYNPMQRSRYLKTHIRQIIKGDYLFIDTDTVISDSLKEIDYIKQDICAVADSNSSLYISQNDEWITNNAKKVGYESIIGEPHFNSGIMLVKDTPITYQLYDKWYHNYEYCRKRGVNIDQLSLVKANKELGYPICEMSGIWNCQIQRKGISLIANAKIIHYLASNKMAVHYLLGDINVFKRIKETRDIPQDIKDLINKPKEAFDSNCRVIGGNQLEFMDSDLYHIFIYYPRFYAIINKTASMYLHIRAYLGNIKLYCKNILKKKK